MIKIRLKNLEFYGYHGAFSEEKKLGQRFLVNIELCAENLKGSLTDSLDDTIDYTKVYETIKSIMEKKPGNHLLEYIATKIAKTVLNLYNELKSVKVTITKERVPYPGITASEVEVICKKEPTESF